MYQFLKFIFGIKLYMFRTVPISHIYFWNQTLHVSDSSSVHHQQFFTVHTAMVYVIQLASRIRTELQCLASLKASIALVSCCWQVVAVVAVTVDCDGLPFCCDINRFFHGWRHFREGCCSLYVEYDLLHTGVHLLWLWELWIVISAWWLCWTWRNSTSLFRSSISVWFQLCSL